MLRLPWVSYETVERDVERGWLLSIIHRLNRMHDASATSSVGSFSACQPSDHLQGRASSGPVRKNNILLVVGCCCVEAVQSAPARRFASPHKRARICGTQFGYAIAILIKNEFLGGRGWRCRRRSRWGGCLLGGGGARCEGVVFFVLFSFLSFFFPPAAGASFFFPSLSLWPPARLSSPVGLGPEAADFDFVLGCGVLSSLRRVLCLCSSFFFWRDRGRFLPSGAAFSRSASVFLAFPFCLSSAVLRAVFPWARCLTGFRAFFVFFFRRPTGF